MKAFLNQVKSCDLCKSHLPHGPRPVLAASSKSKIIIIGQAPGTKVHLSGIPWDDASGNLLRTWMGVEKDDFYNPEKIALIPMGFCYPGKGKSGDLPPRPECAPQWHASLMKKMSQVELIILIGQYAQRYYLGEDIGSNLTETVRNFAAYMPRYFPLPHPSPRNRFWLKKNPWFQTKVLPKFMNTVKSIMAKSG